MRVKGPGYEIELLDEPNYTPGSSDNVRSYELEHTVGDKPREYISAHGVRLFVDGALSSSAVVFGRAGATGIHERSVLPLADLLLLAVCDRVCALEVPTLALKWAVRVDPATCFGLHAIPGSDDFISHGELTVSRFTDAGEPVWEASGRDIFTGDMVVGDSTISVVDFEKQAYEIETATGEIRELPG